MKDLFKRCARKHLGGPGGINCPCCDNGLSKKRKSKHGKNLFSKLRRNSVKQLTENIIRYDLDGE